MYVNRVVRDVCVTRHSIVFVAKQNRVIESKKIVGEIADGVLERQRKMILVMASQQEKASGGMATRTLAAIGL